MEQGVARKSNNFRPKCTEVVWQTRRQEVIDEIGKISKVDSAKTETPGWFQAQTPAIKNITGRMTAAELVNLNAEVEAIGSTGYDENQKRRCVDS